ncbi:RNA exonuclease 1, partial [Biomphalaria glabrata]
MDDNMILMSTVRRASHHSLWGSNSEDNLHFHGWEELIQKQRSRSRSRCYNRSLLLPDIY